jgi:hypothetical protein
MVHQNLSPQRPEALADSRDAGIGRLTSMTRLQALIARFGNVQGILEMLCPPDSVVGREAAPA